MQQGAKQINCYQTRLAACAQQLSGLGCFLLVWPIPAGGLGVVLGTLENKNID